jgi:RNA polymerase sigma factor (sigma-70 family)
MTALARDTRATRARLSASAFAMRCELDLVTAAKHDADARDALLDAFYPLIAGVARSYARSTSVDRAELMQDGVVGLLRALERYDPTIGTPFWAYAGWWVRQAMQQLVTDLMRPVVLSDRAVRQLTRIKRARARLSQANGHEPSVAELSTSTGLSREQIGQLIAAERRPRSLEEPIDGDRGSAESFGDLLADPRAEDGYDGVTWHAHLEELPRLLGALSDRERAIVRGHYGLDGPARTLRELASTLGISAERVRQIEQGAFDKLHDAAGA